MEIQEEIDLSREEENLLDMHSVLNVLNVVAYELFHLANQLDKPEPIIGVTDELTTLAKKLSDKDEAYRQIRNVEELISKIENAVDAAKQNISSSSGKEADSDEKTAQHEEIAKTEENLRLIFDVLRVRAREITARADNPHAWVEQDIEELTNNFVQVFKAIERNSKGGYRIVENIAQFGEQDYYTPFRLNSVNGKTIRMPAVFQDVMRDLIANARKYTSPGGEIDIGLYQGEEELVFVVADTGRGFPEEEISNAIHFGYRGSNVDDRPTRGGGFGLTKAYYVTKKHGGRMWISNRRPHGTRIEIRIPLPEAAEA